jgi:hypothetical protein
MRAALPEVRKWLQTESARAPQSIPLPSPKPTPMPAD